jgi:Carboxypeptidase regulatory-like domain
VPEVSIRMVKAWSWFLIASSMSPFCDASTICGVAANQLGEPLKGAVITVVDLASSERHVSRDSDAEGKACVQGVPDGDYSVEASAAGYMHVAYYPVLVHSPDEITLSFRLLIGSFDPLRSTYVGTDATVYGTLTTGANPAANVKICLFEGSRVDAPKCVNTNDVGQYKLVVPARQYRAELTPLHGRPYTATLDLTNPGYYRNRISLPAQ